MGTWNAFYVKASGDPAISAVCRDFPGVEIEANDEFVGARMPDEAFEPPEAALSALSARLDTDVIWMSFQSTVDAFQFHHWRAGKPLRSLVFGCFQEERTWEKVEGSPEPWEREIFFDDMGLKSCLDYAPTDQDKQELRRIWSEAELLRGRTEPNLDSRACAHKIARYYHLPHYGL